MVKVAGVVEGKEQCVRVSWAYGGHVGHASRIFIKAVGEIVGQTVSRLFCYCWSESKDYAGVGHLSRMSIAQAVTVEG